MKISGPKAFKVFYQLPEVSDYEFSTIVYAYSPEEAAAYIRGKVVKVSLLDGNSDLIIPDQYLKTNKDH